MSKVITSPVDKWPGTVTLSDPLTYPQFLAVQDAVNEVIRLQNDDLTEDKTLSLTQERVNYIYLPGLIACVEEWHLEEFPEIVTAETFPSTPGMASGLLVTWLLSEIVALYREAETVPNE